MDKKRPPQGVQPAGTKKAKTANAQDSMRQKKKKGIKGKPNPKNMFSAPSQETWISLSSQEEHSVVSILSRLDLKQKKKDLTARGIVVGANSVAREIEHGRLTLFVVCAGTKPTILVEHFPQLSQIKKTPMIPLSWTSHKLGLELGLDVAIAIGFKSTCAAPELDLLSKFARVATCKLLSGPDLLPLNIQPRPHPRIDASTQVKPG